MGREIQILVIEKISITHNNKRQKIENFTWVLPYSLSPSSWNFM